MDKISAVNEIVEKTITEEVCKGYNLFITKEEAKHLRFILGKMSGPDVDSCSNVYYALASVVDIEEDWSLRNRYTGEEFNNFYIQK